MNRFLLFVLVAAVTSIGFMAALSSGNIGGFLAATDPLNIVLIIAADLVACSFLFGLATKDYSWVDRLWSTAPVLFVWVYAIKSGMDARLSVAAIVVTVWGARLTYNFARKGGYGREQDYRWLILHTRIANPILWQLFHLLFIACVQIGMFVLFTLPFNVIYTAQNHGLPFTPGYIILCLLMLLFITFESIADQQQWTFQNLKKAGADRIGDEDVEIRADLERGFLTSGLFRLSRHPNYFGELAIWWTVYLIGAYQTMHILNASIIGPILLTALFIGSTRFTEEISSSKYPAYRDYQKRTPPVVPWFPGRSDSEEDSALESGH